MRYKLTNDKPVSDRDKKKFLFNSTVEVKDTDALQIFIPLGAIRYYNGKYILDEKFSAHLISNHVKANELMSFGEAHKDYVAKEKTVLDTRMITMYYLTYVQDTEPKPSTYTLSYLSDVDNDMDIDLILIHNHFYRNITLHLIIKSSISPYMAINNIFNDNDYTTALTLLPLRKNEDGLYIMDFYDEYGNDHPVVHQFLYEFRDEILSYNVTSCKEHYND